MQILCTVFAPITPGTRTYSPFRSWLRPSYNAPQTTGVPEQLTNPGGSIDTEHVAFLKAGFLLTVHFGTGMILRIPIVSLMTHQVDASAMGWRWAPSRLSMAEHSRSTGRSRSQSPIRALPPTGRPLIAMAGWPATSTGFERPTRACLAARWSH